MLADSDSKASIAHLMARLEVLESRVAEAITARRQARMEDGEQRYRGVYLSESDVDRILAAGPHTGRPPGGAGSDDLLLRAESAVDEAERNGSITRLRMLSRAFSLSRIDVELFLIALAPDIDARFEQLYGFLSDDLTRRRASVGLALELVGTSPTDGDARARLGSAGNLVTCGLVEVGETDRPMLSRSLRVPDRVCSFLLGDDTPDRAVEPLLVDTVPALVPGIDQLVALVSAGARLLYLREAPGASGGSVASSAYRALGMATLELDLSATPVETAPEALARAITREAGLCGAALVVGPVDELAARHPMLLRMLTELPAVTTLVGRGGWNPGWARGTPYVLVAHPMTTDVQSDLLRTALGDRAGPDLDLSDCARRRMRPIQLVRAVDVATLRAMSAGRRVSVQDLDFGARLQNGIALERLATRIQPTATWGDMVLRPGMQTVLRQLIGRVRHRHMVLDTWGMSRGSQRRRGIISMFSGPPGTGKTLAAEVVAAELGVDLYVINLATVVDKYIGETEKNLERIFSEAEQVNGVLFFDEADALFGKRSEVRDARDRYANLEVAYLLQRMERFDGIAVLATNLKSNLDEAFLRRLDLSIDFAVPDPAERHKLWEMSLASVPRDDDVDLRYLSDQFELSGGYIRNIAMAASYLAAENSGPLLMRHLVAATAQEYRKLGRLILDREFGKYSELARAQA